MENARVPDKGILPPPSAPSPQLGLPGSSWALLLLQSPTASNSLPSAPSKEILINALHFTASQGSNCQEDYDKLFFLLFQNNLEHGMPSRCSHPQPNCSRAERRQRGAVFTPIIALNWGLFGYNPAEALWTDAGCRPVGDPHST